LTLGFLKDGLIGILKTVLQIALLIIICCLIIFFAVKIDRNLDTARNEAVKSFIEQNKKIDELKNKLEKTCSRIDSINVVQE
jgi:hypothetical protein